MVDNPKPYEGLSVGYALTGSFCTFEKTFEQMRKLVNKGATLLPILSPSSASLDTRFGSAQWVRQTAAEICGREPFLTVVDTEPIGPKKLCDILIIAPCTGNTLGKLAGGITDTGVLMAAKSHLRVGRPLLLAISTNDALGASAKNIGLLLNTKHLFLLPMRQDDPLNKPYSLVANFDRLEEAMEAALHHRQLQPIFE